MSWRRRFVMEVRLLRGGFVRRFLHENVEKSTSALLAAHQQQTSRGIFNAIKEEAEEEKIALPVFGYGDTHSVLREGIFAASALGPSELEASLQERFSRFDFSPASLAPLFESHWDTDQGSHTIPLSFYGDSRFAYICDSAAYCRLRRAHPTSPLGMWVRERLHQGRMLLVSPHPFDDAEQGGRSQNNDWFASSWRHRKLRPGYDTPITKAEMDLIFRFLDIPPLAQTTALHNALLQFIIATSANLYTRDYHRLLIYVTGYRSFAELLPSKLPAYTEALGFIGFRNRKEIDGVMQVWDCLDSHPHPKELPDIGYVPHAPDVFDNRRFREIETLYDRQLNLQNWREFPVDPSFWDKLSTRWWGYWDKEHILYRQGLLQNYIPRTDEKSLYYVCDHSAYDVLSHVGPTTSCNKKLFEWVQEQLHQGRLYVTYPCKPPPPWKAWPDYGSFEAVDGKWSGHLDILWHGNKDDLKRYAIAMSLLRYAGVNGVYLTGDREFVETVLKSPSRREALFQASGFVLIHNVKQVYDCIMEPGDIDITGFTDLDVDEPTLSHSDTCALD